MGNNLTNAVSYPSLEDRKTLDALDPVFVNLVAVLLWIIVISGGFGNLLTILAIILHKRLHQSYMAYVAHLACVDLVISAFLVPMNVMEMLKFSLEGKDSDELTIGCEILSAMSICCLVISILNLMMISVNRYMLICKERHVYGKYFNKKTVSISIILMWIWAVAVTMPMAPIGGLGWGKKYHNCIFQNYKFDVYLYVISCFSIVGLTVPVICTSMCYILIIRKIQASEKKVRPKPNAAGGTILNVPNQSVTIGSSLNSDMERSGNTNSTIQKTLAMAAAKKKAHNRRIVGLIAIFMMFMVCWMPLAVTFIIDYRQQVPGWVCVCLMSFAYINSSINVYMYALTNQQFRHAYRCILTLKLSKINSG